MGMTKMPGKRAGDKHSCGGRSACGARMAVQPLPLQFNDAHDKSTGKFAPKAGAHEALTQHGYKVHKTDTSGKVYTPHVEYRRGAHTARVHSDRVVHSSYERGGSDAATSHPSQGVTVHQGNLGTLHSKLGKLHGGK